MASDEEDSIFDTNFVMRRSLSPPHGDNSFITTETRDRSHNSDEDQDEESHEPSLNDLTSVSSRPDPRARGNFAYNSDRSGREDSMQSSRSGRTSDHSSSTRKASHRHADVEARRRRTRAGSSSRRRREEPLYEESEEEEDATSSIVSYFSNLRGKRGRSGDGHRYSAGRAGREHYGTRRSSKSGGNAIWRSITSVFEGVNIKTVLLCVLAMVMIVQLSQKHHHERAVLLDAQAIEEVPELDEEKAVTPNVRGGIISAKEPDEGEDDDADNGELGNIGLYAEENGEKSAQDEPASIVETNEGDLSQMSGMFQQPMGMKSEQDVSQQQQQQPLGNEFIQQQSPVGYNNQMGNQYSQNGIGGQFVSNQQPFIQGFQSQQSGGYSNSPVVMMASSYGQQSSGMMVGQQPLSGQSNAINGQQSMGSGQYNLQQQMGGQYSSLVDGQNQAQMLGYANGQMAMIKEMSDQYEKQQRVPGQFGQQQPVQYGQQPAGLTGQYGQQQGMGSPYGQQQPPLQGQYVQQQGVGNQYGQQQGAMQGGQYGQQPGIIQGQFGQQQSIGVYGGGMQQQQPPMYLGQTAMGQQQQAMGAQPEQLSQDLQQQALSQNFAPSSGVNSGSVAPIEPEQPAEKEEKGYTPPESEVPLLKDVPKGYIPPAVPVTDTLPELKNFKDSWDPYSPTDIPMFWHIPKAGGSSIKDALGGCHRFVQATEFGITDGHINDKEVAIVYPKIPGGADTDRSPFVNIDSSTVAGIQRAKDMGFADSQLADVVVSPFVFELNDLFTQTAQGRFFSVFRHPIDRAISMFYYIQVADWEPSYKPELKSWTLEQYAQSDVVENNWMTRQLSGQLGGELTDANLEKAMEVVRRKFMVGLMTKIEESMTRFEKYFRWKYKVNPPNQEACREKLMSGGSNSNKANKKPLPQKGEPAWDLLAHQNNYDLQLYKYIEQLFVEQEAFVQGMPDNFRLVDATCCKCDPPTFPPEGFTCPEAVKNG